MNDTPREPFTPRVDTLEDLKAMADTLTNLYALKEKAAATAGPPEPPKLFHEHEVHFRAWMAGLINASLLNDDERKEYFDRPDDVDEDYEESLLDRVEDLRGVLAIIYNKLLGRDARCTTCGGCLRVDETGYYECPACLEDEDGQETPPYGYKFAAPGADGKDDEDDGPKLCETCPANDECTSPNNTTRKPPTDGPVN